MPTEPPSPPPDGRDEPERDERRVERLLREALRKVVDAGYGRLTEGPENVRQLVSELKLPKEALGAILGTLDDTKSGLYRAVAREVRGFLEQTNLADELTRALTTLSFEVKMEVRFIPNDAKLGARPQPDVRSKVSVKRTSTRPPAPSDAVGASQETEAGEDKAPVPETPT